MQEQWQRQREEQEQEERRSLLHTGLILAGQRKTPGTVRVWPEGSFGFAAVKAVKHVDGTITAEDLSRSPLSRAFLGPDMVVRSDQEEL
jgi:hypothetical protein